MKFSEFVIDWIPPIGIVIAGIFALSRWGFSEWLRRKKEIPSLDKGGMIAMGYPISDAKVCVQLDITWRNPGVVPFEVDTNRTSVDIFEVSDDLPEGPLKIRMGNFTDLQEPRHSYKIFEDSRSFKIEPGAESTIPCHFILPVERRVIIRWKIYRKNPENKPFSHTSFLAFDPSTITSTEGKNAPGKGIVEVEEGINGA